jgi:hypothetical protein
MPLPVNTSLYEDVVCTFMDDVSTAGSALYGPITGADANITVKLTPCQTSLGPLAIRVSGSRRGRERNQRRYRVRLGRGFINGVPSYVRRNYHEKLGMRELRQPDQKQRMRSR